jgi:uncharacterized SAM-binding protein YcdF (DUF218 family)
MDLETVARDVNALADFLGKRDVPELTPDALKARFGIGRADVCVLFGGAILGGADVLAEAIRAGVASRYAIVGGAGHTTEAFRERARELCPDVCFADDASEADVFEAYLETRHGLKADLLERRSTNCGNNVTYLRDLLSEQRIDCGSMILIHDESMQRRIEAQVRQEMPGTTPISFASYQVRVVPDGDRGGNGPGRVPGLAFEGEPYGIWTMQRYLTLLMGEMPRLHDDAEGYGPRGRGFIPHVEVPADVWDAFLRLRAVYPEFVRRAVPARAAPEQ